MTVHLDPKEPEELQNKPNLESPYGFAGDGKDLSAGCNGTKVCKRD